MQIQTDLKSALDSWTELSAKAKNRKTPEEEQLEEIRKLLGNLQDKIKHFEEDDGTEGPGQA
ncbi:MAG: hypothetical protein KF802_03850 [Bdellovibrionaceae bacterium]|nr:hypothetical protein [Pseudobdellovibrionaceae bacterium]MBX3035189.1 hypothetical protein [Pseudobdellovibrionaceae bacterium]